MEDPIVEYPHLTDDPNWRVIGLPGGYKRAVNLIPLRRAWNALDDKLYKTFQPELAAVRDSAGECVLSSTRETSHPVRVSHMFVDTPPVITVYYHRALITLRLRVSYANLLPMLHDGQAIRTYRHCSSIRCIHPDHYRLTKGARYSRIMDRLGVVSASPMEMSTESTPPSDPDKEKFYTAFDTFIRKLTDDAPDIGEASYNIRVNEAVVKWLSDWIGSGKPFIKKLTTGDIFHPLSQLECFQVNIDDRVRALFEDASVPVHLPPSQVEEAAKSVEDFLASLDRKDGK